MARWRVRRRMTQQMLADRLGKSKSWVDKVERGVRALDRFSVIQEIAEVLRVDASVLTGTDARRAAAFSGVEGVKALRAALARYDAILCGRGSQPMLSLGELRRRVGYAWLTYQHARYPQVVRMLPDLLAEAQLLHAGGVEDEAADPLLQAYRLTASVLVKLGESDLAWLVADRAMTVAGGDPVRLAEAAVPLGQALRASGRGRVAMVVMIAAAQQVAPKAPHEGSPEELALQGTLLVEAALAAAMCGETRSVGELIDQAAQFAGAVEDGPDHHRTGFGAASVEAARVAAAVELGDGGEAVARHEKITSTSGWGRLAIEHRAAHLVDAARAYLQVGDLLRAGRALVEADRIAPPEVRCRPVARTVIEAVARGGPARAGVAHLAVAIGLTR
ncbi:helix-turn-helix domain-containing protein [Micromonospora okii]|uniref:helix-turn-helix domain-containing protein n=1 Tax=Micromonospora okii TaxID=1182970 RepID=UPI002107D970|nr:helix-turn-helix transcriptional regulator [Micromonospora okii]